MEHVTTLSVAGVADDFEPALVAVDDGFLSTRFVSQLITLKHINWCQSKAANSWQTPQSASYGSKDCIQLPRGILYYIDFIVFLLLSTWCILSSFE